LNIVKALLFVGTAFCRDDQYPTSRLKVVPTDVIPQASELLEWERHFAAIANRLRNETPLISENVAILVGAGHARDPQRCKYPVGAATTMIRNGVNIP
jgi:hypothetical protein